MGQARIANRRMAFPVIKDMRILFVTQTVDENHSMLGFACDWIRSLASQAGVESVHALACDRAGSDITGVRISRIGASSRIARVIAFWRAIAADRSDVAFVHMTPIWVVLGYPIWTIKRMRIVLWYTHGSDSVLLRVAVRLAHATLTATPNAFPFADSKVHAIGHGISPTFGSVVRAPRPDGRLACLSVGRISPRKRVLETIRFFAKIHRVQPLATLTWIGEEIDSEYASAVRREIVNLGLQSCVALHAPMLHAEMPHVYANADLLLHLSGTGSLDKVVLEALCAGCPVFSTNPATAEGAGGQWFWSGELDTMAIDRAIALADGGVSGTERAQMALNVGLDQFWKKAMHYF